MTLDVVIPAAHNPALTSRTLGLAQDNAVLPDTVVGVWDNGVWGRWGTGENVGNYAVFGRHMALTPAELMVVIHNDLLIWETGYDRRIVEAFAVDPKLGIVGFVGSDMFDIAGGRGQYAWSNFQGREGGSPAERHGLRDPGYRPAANLDGCALAFRTEAFRSIAWPEDFPPHHFYDRLFCAGMLQAGWHVGYLGIACDHLNGQTANVFQGYHDLARRWCEERGIFRGEDPNAQDVNWDHQVYLEAEGQFLSEWRDRTRYIPLKVGSDHAIYHLHPIGRKPDV